MSESNASPQSNKSEKAMTTAAATKISAEAKAARTAAPARVVLGIETCTPHGGVALADAAGELVACRWFYARTGYSRRLAANIDDVLKEAGLARGSVAAIAVTTGPGSFTGVRLGLTTAKTLAYALGVPLFPYSSLERLAARWPVPGAVICAALDARRGEIYSGVYRGGEWVGKAGALEAPGSGTLGARANDALGFAAPVAPGQPDPAPLRDERVEPVAALIKSLAAMTASDQIREAEPIVFLGDGAALYWDPIREALGARAVLAAAPWNRPSADAVALAGARALAAGSAGLDPMLAAPRYLRASDAQRKFEEGKITTGQRVNRG